MVSNQFRNHGFYKSCLLLLSFSIKKTQIQGEVETSPYYTLKQLSCNLHKARKTGNTTIFPLKPKCNHLILQMNLHIFYIFTSACPIGLHYQPKIVPWLIDSSQSTHWTSLLRAVNSNSLLVAARQIKLWQLKVYKIATYLQYIFV